MSWLWTPVLVTWSCGGSWIAARRWQGWAICASSEFAWVTYSYLSHTPPLAVMSVIYFGIYARNTWRCRRDLRRDRLAN